jgi:hypothetical protein
MTELVLKILDDHNHVNRLSTGNVIEFIANHLSHGRDTKGGRRIICLSQVLPELKVLAPTASLLRDESERAHVPNEFLGMGWRRADDFQ